MSLRIPLSHDQTLQVEFHEIERRLRKLEKSLGKVGETTLVRVGGGGDGSTSTTDLTEIYNRLAALEATVADIDTDSLQDFGGVGSESVHGLVLDPGEFPAPTGVAEHVLKEDATWGFPFRGLVQVMTSGDDSGEETDELSVLGSLGVLSNLSAHDVECRQVATVDGVTLEGDRYELKSEHRDLVMPATEAVTDELISEVVNVHGGLHVEGDLSAGDAEVYNLHTHGDIEYGDSFWEDLRFPATGFNPAGSTAPPAVLTTNGLLSFSGSADNIIGGVAQLPHAWKEGTTLHAHIHLAFPTAATANTRWLLEYNVANVNEDFTTDTVTYTALTAVTIANANNVARHVLAELGEIPMTGKTVSACVLWRLTRLAASDGADNDTNACTLIEFDLHYERDSPGSSDEYVK